MCEVTQKTSSDVCNGTKAKQASSREKESRDVVTKEDAIDLNQKALEDHVLGADADTGDDAGAGGRRRRRRRRRRRSKGFCGPKCRKRKLRGLRATMYRLGKKTQKQRKKFNKQKKKWTRRLKAMKRKSRAKQFAVLMKTANAMQVRRKIKCAVKKIMINVDPEDIYQSAVPRLHSPRELLQKCKEDIHELMKKSPLMMRNGSLMMKKSPQLVLALGEQEDQEISPKRRKLRSKKRTKKETKKPTRKEMSPQWQQAPSVTKALWKCTKEAQTAIHTMDDVYGRIAIMVV